MWYRILILLKARIKEFYRDRASFGWNLAFPLLIILGFSFIFNNENQTLYKVGIVTDTVQKEKHYEILTEFKDTRYVEFVSFTSQESAIDKLGHHRIDMLIDPAQKKYWISKTSPKGYISEKLLEASEIKNSNTFHKEIINGNEVQYIEWLFPGIIGMNMMFSALFGVGYVIIRYRKNGVLKRLHVTPTRTFEFLTAQVVSRIIVLLLTTIIVYSGCSLLLGFTSKGSLFDLFFIFTLGGFSMISLSMLVAARSSSEEFAGGILNLISWPMMFLSEVWFSLEGAHPFIQKFAKIFPLTHLIEGARKVMNDGAGLADIKIQIFILLGMSILFLTTGSLFFKWQRNY